jgi:hypothetical protein
VRFVSVVAAESVVPKIVLERAVSLFALRHASVPAGPMLQIVRQAKDLQGSVLAFARNEELKRFTKGHPRVTGAPNIG